MPSALERIHFAMARTIEPGQIPLSSSGGLRASQDLYHALLVMSWGRLLTLFVAAYLLLNLLFGAAYWALPGAVQGARPGDFADHLFFSFQTISTVGYGGMAPGSGAGHALVVVELVVGLLLVALATGLFFAKFSRPTARVLFSRPAVIRGYQGRPTFMIRVGNLRANRIVDARLRITLILDERTPEGDELRRFHDLELVRDLAPMLALSWTIFHVIDEGSPLLGLDLEELRRRDALVVVSLSGLDETFAQTVHASWTYQVDDLHFGRAFADVYTKLPDGTRHLDLTRFHDLAPVSPAEA